MGRSDERREQCKQLTVVLRPPALGVFEEVITALKAIIPRKKTIDPRRPTSRHFCSMDNKFLETRLSLKGDLRRGRGFENPQRSPDETKWTFRREKFNARLLVPG